MILLNCGELKTWTLLSLDREELQREALQWTRGSCTSCPRVFSPRLTSSLEFSYFDSQYHHHFWIQGKFPFKNPTHHLKYKMSIKYSQKYTCAFFKKRSFTKNLNRNVPIYMERTETLKTVRSQNRFTWLRSSEK